MKVLHINAGLETGGGLFHIINLLTAAKDKGEDFQLLTFADGPVAQAAREKGIKVAVLNISSRYSRDLPKQIKAYLAENKFDIVNTHGPRANLMMSKIHKQVQSKWVITVHSDPLKDFADRGIVGKVFEKLNISSLKKADHLLAVTNRFKNILHDELQIPGAKISVIYNGIFFDENEPKKVSHSELNFINVARMETVKAQPLLLEAFSQLQLPDARLHFVGDGSQRAALEEQAEQLGLQKQVVFHGFLKQTEINQLYQTMDFAVLTSYSESFPLVLLEAANNHVALISTDVGDIKMMIPDEKNGFVAKIGDVSSIRQQLQNAASLSVDERTEMAQREKEYLSSNFSIYQQLASIKQIYQTILN